jgi:hypothetical protein
VPPEGGVGGAGGRGAGDVDAKEESHEECQKHVKEEAIVGLVTVSNDQQRYLDVKEEEAVGVGGVLRAFYHGLRTLRIVTQRYLSDLLSGLSSGLHTMSSTRRRGSGTARHDGVAARLDTTG